MTIEPDQLIDNRYKVIKHLGQGGMGTVWKAVDQQAGGDVVIKMPLDDSNPVILQRFGNEARMMRQHSMGNQSILDIQGMGDIDGVPYYVMRFLSGGSLEDRCPIVDEQGQPDFRSESYEWLTTIAKALDFLHSKDVLHRDVKPGNILFNESGDAYLVDFGIVKSPLEASSFTSAPTAANTSPGTIEYMPPEVLAGEVDAISGLGDQYALAVTLYEMIAGQRPFTGPTETAIYRAIEKGANSLAEVKAGIPPAAAAVISRALNSDPSKRFKTCREFATAFDSALRSSSDSSLVSAEIVAEPSEAPTGMVPIGGSDVTAPIRGGVAVPEPSGGGGGLKSGAGLDFGERIAAEDGAETRGGRGKVISWMSGALVLLVAIAVAFAGGLLGRGAHSEPLTEEEVDVPTTGLFSGGAVSEPLTEEVLDAATTVRTHVPEETGFEGIIRLRTSFGQIIFKGDYVDRVSTLTKGNWLFAKVKYVDGVNRLTIDGLIDEGTLAIRTSFGEVNVPWSKISEIRLHIDANDGSEITFKNADTVKSERGIRDATIATDTESMLQLTTSFGLVIFDLKSKGQIDMGSVDTISTSENVFSGEFNKSQFIAINTKPDATIKFSLREISDITITEQGVANVTLNDGRTFSGDISLGGN